MDFQSKLIELEAAKRKADERITVARAMADLFFELYVLPYQVEIKAIEDGVTALETEIRDAAREEALAGDFHLHSHITIRHKPAEWDYSEKDVIKGAVDNNETDLIRIKTELNKVPFKQGLAKGKYQWANATKRPDDVIVTIEPLGDLPIIQKHAELALQTEE